MICNAIASPPQANPSWNCYVEQISWRLLRCPVCGGTTTSRRWWAALDWSAWAEEACSRIEPYTSLTCCPDTDGTFFWFGNGSKMRSALRRSDEPCDEDVVLNTFYQTRLLIILKRTICTRRTARWRTKRLNYGHLPSKQSKTDV